MGYVYAAELGPNGSHGYLSFEMASPALSPESIPRLLNQGLVKLDGADIVMGDMLVAYANDWWVEESPVGKWAVEPQWSLRE